MVLKITLNLAVSLDGFIARKNGKVDFLDKYNELLDMTDFKKFSASMNSIVMGNTTYEQYGRDPAFKELYKDKQIFVMTHNLKEDEGNVKFVSNKDFIKELEGNLWLMGGSITVNDFLKEDLIDEFIITLIPELIGEGIPLFKNNKKSLKLVKLTEKNAGIIELIYKK